MAASLKDLLTKIPLFAEADLNKVLEVLGECETPEFRTGEFVCHEGEYDENCYIVLSGVVEVIAHGKGNARVNKIPLREGEMFGEIAVLTGNPRIADIIAAGPVILLKITRQVLFILIDECPSIKQKLDNLYRERALATHLLTIPVFAGIPEAFINELKNNVELLTVRKNDVIFRQGEVADAFYLVRYGFVKVHLEDAGRERVIAYLKEGHYFGEMGLLKASEKRTATVSAINRAELIKISKADFDKLIAAHPSMKNILDSIVAQREERTVQASKDIHFTSTLNAAIDLGVIQSKAILIIDLTKCVHCDTCVEACAALHNGHTRLSRRGIMLNDFLLVPTSCRHCSDPTCMSKCPTGAISRDFDGEIYHKSHCIGCGSCARNCPYGNISIITLDAESPQAGFVSRLTSLFRVKKGHADNIENGAPKKFSFPGDRNFVDRSDGGKLPGDRNLAGPGKTGSDVPARKQKRAVKKAVKCDMCRDYRNMGCVYNCPRNAARRVDPTEFFADFTSIG